MYAIRSYYGSISVYSEVDSGTVFKIYLPVEDTNNLAESLMADVDATLIHGEGRITSYNVCYTKLLRS